MTRMKMMMMMIMAAKSKGREGRGGSINVLNSSSQWAVKGEEILYKFDKLGNR